MKIKTIFPVFMMMVLGFAFTFSFNVSPISAASETCRSDIDDDVSVTRDTCYDKKTDTTTSDICRTGSGGSYCLEYTCDDCLNDREAKELFKEAKKDGDADTEVYKPK